LVVHRIAWTETDTTVVILGPKDQPATAVLRLADSAASATGLRRHVEALAALHADPRLAHWAALVPRLLAEGEMEEQVYTLEQALPGEPARILLADEATLARMQAAAAVAIGELHRRTASKTTVGPEMLTRWVDKDLLILNRWNAAQPAGTRQEEALERLAAGLHTALEGRTVWRSWIHGDYAPGNILVAPGGSPVTGIVDWELARPDDLPLLDILQLLLSTRMVAQRSDLGDVMRALLEGAPWTPDEQTLLDKAQEMLPGDPLEPRSMVLLAWLRHIAEKLARSPGYGRQHRWVRKNISNVLAHV
jgi:aminoglycoside phosphotransferase (APT) family kinase protein